MVFIAEIGMFIWGVVCLVTGKLTLSTSSTVQGAPARWLGLLGLLPLTLAVMVGLVVGVYFGLQQQQHRIQELNLVFALIEVAALLITLGLMYAIGIPIAKTQKRLREREERELAESLDRWDDDDDHFGRDETASPPAVLPPLTAAPPTTPCPTCGVLLRYSVEQVDKKMRCGKCGAIFVAPPLPAIPVPDAFTDRPIAPLARPIAEPLARTSADRRDRDHDMPRDRPRRRQVDREMPIDELRSIAFSQKGLIYCILATVTLYIAIVALLITAPPNRPASLTWAQISIGLGLVAAGVTATFFVFSLATRTYGVGGGILLGLLTMIPGVGLILLLIINSKATSLLNLNGVRVGLLGARASDFNDLVDRPERTARERSYETIDDDEMRREPPPKKISRPFVFTMVALIYLGLGLAFGLTMFFLAPTERRPNRQFAPRVANPHHVVKKNDHAPAAVAAMEVAPFDIRFAADRFQHLGAVNPNATHLFRGRRLVCSIYNLPVNVGESFDFAVRWQRHPDQEPPRLVLYNNQGQLLTSSETGKLVYRPAESGWAKLFVLPGEGIQEGMFTLNIVRSFTDRKKLDFNGKNTIEISDRIAPGSFIRIDDRDALGTAYTIDLAAGPSYWIDVTSETFDPVIIARSMSRFEHGLDAGRRQRRILLNPTQTEEFVVSITSPGGAVGGGSTGDFRLRIRSIDVPVSRVLPIRFRQNLVKPDPMPLPEPKEIGVVKVQSVLSARAFRPGVAWSPDGQAFFLLNDKNVLSRFSTADGTIERQAKFETDCESLAMSSEGLVVAAPMEQELWILDPGTLQASKKIFVPNINRVVAGRMSSLAVATSRPWVVQSGDLHLIDLKQGAVRRSYQAGMMKQIVAAPDGEHVLLTPLGSSEIRWLAIEPDALHVEAIRTQTTSFPIDQPIAMSPDGRHFALPSADPPPSGSQLPKLDGAGGYLFETADFRKPVSSIKAGVGTSAPVVALDPASGHVLVSDPNSPLSLFTYAGERVRDVAIPQLSRSGRFELSASPAGFQAVLCADDRAYLVTMTK